MRTDVSLPRPKPSPTATATFTNLDAGELYFMLRNRGASTTKDKLIKVLEHLDPAYADALKAFPA